MNRYSHLRRDTRGILPGWINYPLASDCEVAWTYRDGCNYIQIMIAEQDCRWVVGVNFWIDNAGGGYSPGRKWGDFSSRKEALIYALGEMLDRTKNSTAKKAIKQAICYTSHTQLSLF